MDRAAALVRNIRIVKPQPVPLIARLLRHLFSDQVRQLVIANVKWAEFVWSAASCAGGLGLSDISFSLCHELLILD